MSFKTIDELDLSEGFSMECANDSEVKAVWSFFQRFEEDTDPNDLSIPEESYFTGFLFCNPEKVDLINREDFLRFLPAMTVKYEESGFKEKRVKGIKVLRLDEKYLLANVSWIMKFGKDEQEQEFDDIKATYILKNEEDDYKIILQLDHQKLSDFF